MRDDSTSRVLLLLVGVALTGIGLVIILLEPSSWMNRLVFYALVSMLLARLMGLVFLAITPLTRPDASVRRRIVPRAKGRRTSVSINSTRDVGVPLKRAGLWAAVVTSLGALFIEQQLNIWNTAIIIAVWIGFDLAIRRISNGKAR